MIILTIILTACNSGHDKSKMEGKEVNMTVIEHVKKSTGLEIITDTLLNSQSVNLTKTKVDLYYCWKNFHIPYYMPTGDIYKDSIKTKECDWSVYPKTVKCYEYDTKNRVVKMQVEGSGTTGSYTFKYGENDKIIEMTDNSSDKYKMTYDDNGNLLTMTVHGEDLERSIDFDYEKE